MASPSNCNDDQLRQLLNGDDTGTAAHLEVCPRCQRRLEELAASDAEWQEVREEFSGACDERDPLNAELRERPWSDALRSGGSHEAKPAWTESMAKQLLGPPSHPEMLGRLGRYEVERLIGSGGMGIVFKAFDTELNRPVAIKVLAPHLAGSGAARQRFSREARAAAAVVHEHVVAIHNVEAGGLASSHQPEASARAPSHQPEASARAPFLVMQYVAGESLQARLDRQGPLALRETLRIAHQTAAGLAAAHAQGLVHRDVKPSNILLEQGIERALLTDFGLARAADDASLTHTGYLPGTPHYMSPEQARGDSIDARSDLFSLGSVMYAMCTGRPPFRPDTSFGVLRRITDTEARPIRETNADIPAWLANLIDKLLAKDPSHRFASAAEAAATIEQCLAHVQQPATVPLPEACRVSKTERLPPRLLLTVAALILLLVGGIATTAYIAKQYEQAMSTVNNGSTEGESVTAESVNADLDWNTSAQEMVTLSREAAALQERSEWLWDRQPSAVTNSSTEKIRQNIDLERKP
ncbi:MAG TPA: serine/threonine-protein kinase [Pirellulaceae bacterium]|jgi:serine/threonine protein kinase